MKPAFDYLPHPLPVPAASLMAFPYTRHLDGFLQHKDWANVQVRKTSQLTILSIRETFRALRLVRLFYV